MQRLFKISFILFLITLVIASNSAIAFEISIIRDDETEATIKQMIIPVLKAARMPHESINIFILNDPTINAFVLGGQNIFINSGLIAFSTKPEVLIGVMAHELGHIVGGHLIAQKGEIEMLKRKLLLNLAVGFLAAKATNSAEGGMAAFYGMSEADKRMFLKYTRTQENEADSAAIKYLERAGITNEGLVELLQHFAHNKKLFNPDLDPYLSTHPVSEDRITHIKSANKEKSTHNNSSILTPELKEKYATIVAKIRAWTTDEPAKVLSEYQHNTTTDLYARAIIYFRLSHFDEAVTEIKKAIKLEPNNPYLHEQLAQFYFETGKISDAVSEFAVAHKLYPKSITIALGYAHALTSIATQPQTTIKITDLVLSKEPTNIMAWRLQGVAYKQNNDSTNSNLAFAWEALLKGDFSTAKKLIAVVEKSPHLNSKESLRVNDFKKVLSNEIENQSSLE